MSWPRTDFELDKQKQIDDYRAALEEIAKLTENFSRHDSDVAVRVVLELGEIARDALKVEYET
jgi:predicted DNA binding CopG/RHH family protein